MTEAYLRGRVAVVTGGASGIGRAIALALAGRGAAVAVGSLLDETEWSSGALTYRPSAQEMLSVKEAIEAAGARAHAGPLDVRSDESIDRFLAATETALGPVDILVNAAGIGGSETIAGHSDETWTTTIDVNLNGPYRMIKRCLPGMMERRWGRIINVASTAANVGFTGSGAYCAAKAGLLGLTRCVALEGAPYGISCNAINPGQVDTGSTRLSFQVWKEREGIEQTLEAYNAQWAEANPQRRMIQPQEIAALAVFLCRDEALGISAEDITVSGGALW